MIFLAEIVFPGKHWPAKGQMKENVSAKLKFIHFEKDKTHSDEKEEFSIKADPGTKSAQILEGLRKGMTVVVEKHKLNIQGEKTPPFYYRLFTRAQMGLGVQEYMAKHTGDDGTGRAKYVEDEQAENLLNLWLSVEAKFFNEDGSPKVKLAPTAAELEKMAVHLNMNRR